MSYKKYSEQVQEHLNFLRSKGFDIDNLKVNADFVRCRESEVNQMRGELAYKTMKRGLNNGLTGLQTWFRGPGGVVDRFQTYGLGPDHQTLNKEPLEASPALTSTPTISDNRTANASEHDEAGRRAYGFWLHSDVNGRSEYLEKKHVGYYGIRFRSSEQYGATAIVPMNDHQGRLWSYQILNCDGSKRYPKNARTEGLFHLVGAPVDGRPIGIAESYVTSASCYELTGIPTACAFNCQNLKNLVIIFKQRYPQSRLIIFADNDRHLEVRGTSNQGLLKAQEAINSVESGVVLVTPDFKDSAALKDRSDWNDLIHDKGFEYARTQLKDQLRKHLPQIPL